MGGARNPIIKESQICNKNSKRALTMCDTNKGMALDIYSIAALACHYAASAGEAVLVEV